MTEGKIALDLICHVRQTTTCCVCKSPFRSPRLLPACLHTLCMPCLESRVVADSEELRTTIMCPVCNVDSVVPDGGLTNFCKDYSAEKLLESTGHLLHLNQGSATRSRVWEFVRKLYDACECPVCRDLCVSPRMLPCSHTFCEKCLESCEAGRRRFLYSQSQCPMCRCQYLVPATGVRALPESKLLTKISNKLSEPEVKSFVTKLLEPDSMPTEMREVVGVTELFGRLYVLTGRSKNICVMMADSPFPRVSDVHLAEVSEPTDMVASPVAKCLYITDIADSGCVWRVEIEEKIIERQLKRIDVDTSKFAEGTMSTSDLIAAVLGSKAESRPVQDSDNGHNMVAEVSSAAACTDADGNQNTSELPAAEAQSKSSSNEAADACDRKCKDPSAGGSAAVRRTPTYQESSEMMRNLLERTGVAKMISEREDKRPFVFQMSLRHTVHRWVEGVRAIGASVGSDGQLLLVADTGHLVIYGVDGHLVAKHSLPSDLQKPRHAVVSSTSGTFIVSHSSADGSNHGISELIFDPLEERLKTVRRYNEGCRDQQPGHLLKWPRHLYVDEDGWIIVADCGNDRILFVDSSLQLRRAVITREDFRRPWRLCYMPVTGYLAIGSVTGSLQIFHIGGERCNRNKTKSRRS